jgi:cyanophycinase
MAYDDNVVEEIRKLTGIFFTGGDQERIESTYFDLHHHPTPVLSAIAEQYEKDLLVVAGSSAGTTIQQSTPMVSGGLSYQALVNGAYDHIDDENLDNLSYDKAGGFGFFSYGFLDTHFGTRGRQGRMIVLMMEFQDVSTFGVGIDEDTALVLSDDIGEIIGSSGVYFFDLSNIHTSNNGNVFAENILVHYLTEGDAFDFKILKPVIQREKSSLKGHEIYSTTFSTCEDLFNSPDNHSWHPEYEENWRFVTTDLFKSKVNTVYSYTWENSPTIRFDFTKTDDSEGFVLRGDTRDNDKVSYINLMLKYEEYGSDDESNAFDKNQITPTEIE